MRSVFLSCTDDRTQSQAGVAMIELALMLPFLVLLFFGGTEFVRVLQAKQNLAAIVREGANSVFRECLELEKPDPCMLDVYSRIDASANVILPTAGVRLSLFVLNTTSGTVTLHTQGGIVSKYSVAGFNVAGSDLETLLAAEERVAVAEARFTFDQIIPVFPNTEFYDAAIF